MFSKFPDFSPVKIKFTCWDHNDPKYYFQPSMVLNKPCKMVSIFPDFSSKCQFSLTQNKIPWLFPDLEELFPWPFRDLWQPWLLWFFREKKKICLHQQNHQREHFVTTLLVPTTPSVNLKIPSQGGQNSQNQVSQMKIKIMDAVDSEYWKIIS